MYTGHDISVKTYVTVADWEDEEKNSGVAEVSVYVADDSRGKGIGRQLLKQLIAESEQTEFGPFKPVCSLRTAPALLSITVADSEKSGSVSALVSSMESGAIPCSWNVAVAANWPRVNPPNRGMIRVQESDRKRCCFGS